VADHISRDEILMGRDVEYPLSDELESNLADLLMKLNNFRDFYNIPMVVSSGYRPGRYNTAAGGAQHSNHIVCKACDFHDPDGTLDAFCMANLDKLTEFGLCLESPTSTPGWTHLDTVVRAHNPFLP
jgi:uncharacterized protein YcbK (DUF882 family)